MTTRWASIAPAVRSGEGASSRWPDDRLVRACLDGDEDAWAALIEKYKRLIYAIPIRGGASPQDAADIFQAVCLELFAELPQLRRVESLRSWLITVASHKLHHLRQQQRRPTDVLDDETSALSDPSPPPAAALERLDRDQRIREAVESLNPRCRELVRRLFYEQPPRAYRDVAQALGIATGSIGFIRARCLARLERLLNAAGIR